VERHFQGLTKEAKQWGVKPDQSSVLRRLVQSYERFLFVCGKYRTDEDLSPTMAVDLIFHTHMIDPTKYKKDVERMIGYHLSHSPWPTGAPEPTKVSEKMKEIWQKEFGVSLEDDIKFDDPKYEEKADY